MDIKARNKEVKRILSQEYGRKNVLVTNGKGTSWGWCYVEIKTFNSRTNNRQSIKKRAEQLLSDVEFYHFYTDDNTKLKNLLITVQII